ncbi:MAG TPA: type II toxin-antitoxin system prevent-host-death family antitoxin [Stellaceae bacterium]|nr:type II toxin-antitoxin system prevent-host-death family antitoxin [Stellaceae bacterium]
MSDTITIHAAKTHLSRLILRVEAGEEIVIARGRTPVARLVPMAPAPRRVFGALRGKIAVEPRFFEPLPPGELEVWER